MDRGGGDGSRRFRPIERWTAEQRVALVVSILKGDTSVAEAARQHGLTVAEVENWRDGLSTAGSGGSIPIRSARVVDCL